MVIAAAYSGGGIFSFTAREAIAAFEDGADFDFTIDRLAAIGEKMNILLG